MPAFKLATFNLAPLLQLILGNSWNLFSHVPTHIGKRVQKSIKDPQMLSLSLQALSHLAIRAKILKESLPIIVVCTY